MLGEKISGAGRNAPELELRIHGSQAREKRLRRCVGARLPFVKRHFQGGKFTGGRERRIEDAETASALSPDVVLPVPGFIYVFQQLGVEMKAAAGEHDGTLGRGYEEKLPDIAAGIETSFERKLVYLRQALRGDHFLVNFGLLYLVHVGADQTGRARRDHPLQNVVDAGLGGDRMKQTRLQRMDIECGLHGRLFGEEVTAGATGMSHENHRLLR